MMLLFFRTPLEAQSGHTHAPIADTGSFFENFFKIYTPRQVCMFHEPAVIWLHVLSDAFIALAYYSIPIALVYFVRRRKDVAFGWVFWLFAIFILACGTTHAIGVLDIWMPFYKLDGVAKGVTAVASVATAAALWPLMPKALALPSPAQLERTVRERTAELYETNEALRASQEQLRLKSAALEAAANGIVITDRTGRIIWVNPAFTKLTGYSAAEVVGGDPRLLQSGQHPAGFYKEMWDSILSGQVWRGQLVNRRKDGSHYSEQMTITPVRLGSAEVTHFIAIKEDISEQKRAEEALHESERHFRELADAMPQIVWAADPNGRLDYYNRRWYELTRATEGESGDESWLPVVHPDDRQRCLDVWYESVRTGKPYQIEYRFKFPTVAEYRWHLGRALPVRLKDGRIVRWYGTCTDIHDLRLAHQALATAKTEAERANAAKDQFLAVLSHELRTPLTPVLAAVSLVERREHITPELRHSLDIIRRNVTLEARIIDDLLDLTRIVRGKIALERKPVGVQEILERVVEVCKPDIETRRLQFGSDIRCPDVQVNADISRLQQVFWNLLKNSIKFTPEGGCIGLKCWTEGQEVNIEVLDSGIGIEPEALDKIFDAFEQANPKITRQFGGLGLGLAISRRLVEMHDGKISASSKGSGQGAAFRVTLPVFLGKEESLPDSQGEPRAPARRMPTLRILLVEDNGDTAQVIRTLLETSGYQVRTAGDVAGALEMARANFPDLLISDLGLPDGSGTDLMRELRGMDKHIAGIALSGYGREEDVRESKEAGFLEHLTKPVDFEILLKAVERVAAS